MHSVPFVVRQDVFFEEAYQTYSRQRAELRINMELNATLSNEKSIVLIKRHHSKRQRTPIRTVWNPNNGTRKVRDKQIMNVPNAMLCMKSNGN